MQELGLALNPWYFGSVCNDLGEKLPAQSCSPSVRRHVISVRSAIVGRRRARHSSVRNIPTPDLLQRGN